jgi:hypothetical protein
MDAVGVGSLRDVEHRARQGTDVGEALETCVTLNIVQGKGWISMDAGQALNVER